MVEGGVSLLFAPISTQTTPAFGAVTTDRFEVARRPVWSGRWTVGSLAHGQRGRAVPAGWVCEVGVSRLGIMRAGTVLTLSSILYCASFRGREMACSRHGSAFVDGVINRSRNLAAEAASGTPEGFEAPREALPLFSASEWETLSDEERQMWRERKQAEKMKGKLKLERAVNASSPLKWKGAGLEIVFDLSYGGGATAKMNSSLARQLSMAYSYAKNTPDTEAPAMHITSYTGGAKLALERRGAASWITHKHAGSLREVFRDRLDDLVYLSPDGEKTLETLTPGKVYVIGGIVDRTVSKRVSLDEASGRRSGGAAIPTYRLPIDENIPRSFQGRGHVLNINTVLHLLMVYKLLGGERGCWEDAIVRVMYAEAPERFRDTIPPEQRARLDGTRPPPSTPRPTP